MSKARVEAVEGTLEEHIAVCRERHAVINTKLDSLADGMKDIRALVVELARQDGKQDAKIEAVEQATKAGGKAGAVVGGGVATAIGAIAALGETLGWW